MVNKKFCLGILLMVLVFGITVVGCKDDVQIVAFEYAESTSNVYVQLSSNGDDDVVVVFFDSVKSAVSYDIYVQYQNQYQNGKVADIKYLSTVQARGDEIGTDSFTKMQLLPPRGVLPEPGQSFSLRFGVTVTDIDKNLVPSKIVWSDYFTVIFTRRGG
jgi:hypothetical protein